MSAVKPHTIDSANLGAIGTVAQALAWAGAQVDAIDARMLLQHVLGVNHAYLITHAEKPLTETQAGQYGALVLQRVSGVPVAYLTGEREFYSRVFRVTQAVLVPRPETELLVDLALATITENRPYHILDLGTGSGAIAITLAKHRPRANITAVDVSHDAVDIARWNARKLEADNVRVLTGSWFEPLDERTRFDVIVSNPPYVAPGDPHLQQGDLRFEPAIALSAPDDGLACLSHIITKAPAYLVDGGRLLLEHGYNQSARCRQLMRAAGFESIAAHQDLAGIERVCEGHYFA